MANCSDRFLSASARLKTSRSLSQRGVYIGFLLFIASAILLAPGVKAQSSPHVTGIDPAMGKVNDSVTVSGENLGKDAVAGVFLSDDKDDYKAAITDQGADKIVLKIPQVKAGGYNVSIQVGDKILILPVKFTVSE